MTTEPRASETPRNKTAGAEPRGSETGHPRGIRTRASIPSIRVLSPVGAVSAEQMTAPALPADWSGLSVGFIDNTKHNFDRLAREMGDLLRERHGVRTIVHRRKANASTAAPPEIVAELAKECDVVFAGSGD